MINEYNTIIKDPINIPIRLASCYPNIYRTAMSSLGYQVIYGLTNAREDTWCERVIYPSVRSIESNSPLNDFDIISFTLQYEEDYFNIIKMLKKANIPIRKEDRSEKHPLIIAGGPCASSNPMPVADFIDIFVIGDAELILVDILDLYKNLENPKTNIKKFLEIKGTYSKNSCLHPNKSNYNSNTSNPNYNFNQNHNSNPDFDSDNNYTHHSHENTLNYKSNYSKNAKLRCISTMGESFYTTEPIVVKTDEKEFMPVFGQSIMINISRGCSRGCRFCMSTYLYRPNKELELKKIFKIAEATRENTGLNKVSLIGASVTDYSKIEELLEGLYEKGFQISTPSLRIESINSRLLEILAKSGAKTITIAPESTYNLRKSLNKDIDNDKIADVIKKASEYGLKLKLYFLFGIPNESKEDLAELCEYVNLLSDLAISNFKIQSKNVRSENIIKFSFNPLIPKANTPLQWESYDMKAIKNKIKYLKKNIKNKNIKFGSAKMGLVQYVLSCKSSKIGDLIEKTALKGLNIIEWKQYAKGYDVNEALPWDEIDIGLNKSFLENERNKFYNSIITPWCRNNNNNNNSNDTSDKNNCYSCGKC
ncbi:MAG: radical SAM protein [Methanobacteriaceae archaeon]